MLRIPHFLDNRVTDDGEVVSLTRRPRFTPRKMFWYSFLLESEYTRGSQCGWKDYVIEKIYEHHGIRTLDFPACSTAYKPTTLHTSLRVPR
jgi:hypothetical protein